MLYISYLFYPPLYIAGPIISFNAFASYMREPQQECRGRNLVKYSLRWLFALFLFVTFSHFLYVFAINVNGPLVSFSEDSSPIFDRLFGYGMHGEAIFWWDVVLWKSLASCPHGKQTQSKILQHTKIQHTRILAQRVDAKLCLFGLV